MGAVPRDTGFPSTDAQFDYSRARRRHVLSTLGRRLRGQPGDVDLILPFDEVVDALGRVGERSIGLQSIALDSIVGTVGRGRDFDRAFRPVSGRTRTRWERIANAQRRGQDMPPISAYRIGDMHFVRDGHHRVSVARALGLSHIDAYVTEVRTMVGAEGTLTLGDLPSSRTSACSSSACRSRSRRAPRSLCPTRGAMRSSPRASRRGDSG